MTVIGVLRDGNSASIHQMEDEFDENAVQEMESSPSRMLQILGIIGLSMSVWIFMIVITCLYVKFRQRRNRSQSTDQHVSDQAQEHDSNIVSTSYFYEHDHDIRDISDSYVPREPENVYRPNEVYGEMQEKENDLYRDWRKKVNEALETDFEKVDRHRDEFLGRRDGDNDRDSFP